MPVRIFYYYLCCNNLFILFTKITIIGEIWKSRAKLLRNRLFEKIVSVTG